MKTIINLSPGLFGIQPNEVYCGAGFTVTAFMFPGDIAALALQNQRGTLTLLPYQDLMIWDAVFDGQSLKAKPARRSHCVMMPVVALPLTKACQLIMVR